MSKATYTFTRRAHNASFSDRTAELGSLRGSLRQAIRKAINLSYIEGEVTINLETVPIAKVYRYRTQGDPRTWVSLDFIGDHLPELFP